MGPSTSPPAPLLKERRRSARSFCLVFHHPIFLNHRHHTEGSPDFAENGQPLLGWRGYRWWVYPRAYDARARYQHLREARGANMNPAMNAQPHLGGAGLGVTKGFGGFDGCSDLNSFTAKTPGVYVYLFPRLILLTFFKQKKIDTARSPHNITCTNKPIGASPFVAVAANNVELGADIESPPVVLLQRIRCSCRESTTCCPIRTHSQLVYLARQCSIRGGPRS